MDTFEKLEHEKRNIILAKLKNEKVDFSSLREAAKEHAEKTGAVLNYEGSDLELWRSVTKYFRQMLHSR